MNAPFPPPQGPQNALTGQMPMGQAQSALPMQAQMAQALVPQPKPVTHDVTIVTTRKRAQAKVMGVPPEEFGIERGARDIPTCNYCFHDIVTKTEGQLIAEGFDEEQIKGLAIYTGMNEIETLARDSVQEHMFASGDSVNSAARLVRLTEHYVRMDYEGNGKPCLYQVITGSDHGDILKRNGKECITPFDAIPFAATTPVPQTHRFFGRSIADLVMPIQREKTAMKRGALDNLYLVNNPRVEVSESHAGPNTLDDLLISRPGNVVRSKMPGGIAWQVVPNITAGIFPMLQYLDAELETKSGLSKQSQGIDANALQNQSATAVAQVFSASQMRVKLIARIMAEGVKEIFALLHGTIRKHGQKAETVRLRNVWREVDPRNWKTRNDMTISVGLGTGGKAQQFAQLMALANIQKEMIAAGKTNLVDDAKLFNTAQEISKVMGHKNADRFFNDPSEKNPDGSPKYPPPPPQTDPKAQAAQVKAQTDQATAAHKAQLEQQKAQNDAIHQQVKTQAEIELAKIKADLDAKLKMLDAAMKAAGIHQQMQHDHLQHHANQAETALGMVATAHAHDTHMEQAAQSHQTSLEQMKAKPQKEKTDG